MPPGLVSARVSLVFAAHTTRLPRSRLTDTLGRLLASLSPPQPARSYPSLPKAPGHLVPLDADEGTKAASSRSRPSVTIGPAGLKGMLVTGCAFTSDCRVLSAPDGLMECRITAELSYPVVATMLLSGLNHAVEGVGWFSPLPIGVSAPDEATE